MKLSGGCFDGLFPGRCVRAACLLLILAGSGFAQAQQGPGFVDGTPEIDASIAQQNWPRALTQLDARIASNPRDVQAQFKRATVLVHLGRDDDAIAAFTALTQQYPELPEPYNNLAALYAKQGKYLEARSTLEAAIRANPAFALGFHNLGDVYLKLAVDAYSHAAELNHADTAATARAHQIAAIVTPAATAAAASAVHSANAARAPLFTLPDTPAEQTGTSGRLLSPVPNGLRY
jgi:tetratricopeptide (TPR) repeat protein